MCGRTIGRPKVRIPRKPKPTEKTYDVKDIMKGLGISRTAATARIRSYYKKHNIKHKKRTPYRPTQKQFDEMMTKRSTISSEMYQDDLIKGIKTGRKDEQIKNDIRIKYGVKNMGALQGTINLYRNKISKGQIK